MYPSKKTECLRYKGGCGVRNVGVLWRWKEQLCYFILFYGFMVKQKLYLQAEPRVCEQPVFTAQQDYINYSYL